MPPKPRNAAASAVARWALKGARFGIGVLIGAWSLLLVAWLTLHWGILPHVGQWRPQIEQQASRALGIAVAIGRVEARSRGWAPTFELSDVVLRDREGREALRLPHVVAVLSARSVLALELRFSQLLVDGPVLEIRRDAEGRIHVAGLEAGGGASDGRFADWLFEQHEVVIRDGALRWSDALHPAPPLELSAVNAVVRNRLRHHDLRFDATPPYEWGARFSLRGRFTQPLFARAGDWRRWSGTLHADLPHADIGDLRRRVKLPFEVDGGEGALRAWFEIANGDARSATVDVALRGVALQLASDVERLEFESVEGRILASRIDGGATLAAQRFGFVTGDGIVWPRGDAKLTLRRTREGAPLQGGEFSADRLDLGLMARIATRIPLGGALRRLLEELQPRGIAQGVALKWDGALDALPPRYQARARFTGLTLAAASAADGGIGRPGLANADIDLDAGEHGGEARVVLDRGALEFPGVFADPVIPLERFSAQLAWRIEAGQDDAPPAVELKVGNARFANADAQGELAAVWRTGDAARRLPGALELSGKLGAGRAASTAQYLPLGIPASARDYVQRAVRGGRIVGATFKVKGGLSDFPFASAKPGSAGVFHIAGRVEDVDLLYVPDDGAGGAWPAFANVAGELVFDRTSMEIRNARGRLWGVELSKVNGGIRDLVAAPTLAIEGIARGPASDLLRYVNATPVGEWTDFALKQASAAGAGELKLALSIPLDEPQRGSVKGSVTLTGNDVRLRPDTPLLAAAKGRVDFTRKTLTIAGAQARILGGDATIDGGSAADGTLRFAAQGTLSADGLRRAAELGPLSKLGASLSGQTKYRAQLQFGRGAPELSITSNLGGLAIDLPPPLRKAADETLPLRVQSSVLADARDQLRVELGSLVQAQFVRDVSHDEPRVLRGGIGIGDAAPAPSAGVQASVNVASFDAGAWSKVLDRLGGRVDDESDYVPRAIAFRTAELLVGSRRLTGFVAGATRGVGEATWRANVEADQLGGYVELQPGQPGRVFARLSRLSLPQAHAESVETLLEHAPSSAPALDIVVDDFELRGKKLGRVEIEAANRPGADGAREWQLSKFNLATPEARFAGVGRWGGAQRRIEMDFQLELGDSGAFLERLGTGKALRGGKGRLVGRVSWAGSPLDLNVPTLDGQLNITLDAGQFLKGDPGAARLLSVLNLQALPRRLALDFRDIFQQGFAFDNVSGDVTIRDGVASTNNLRMRGVQAAVLMEGQADLEHETQDLRVIVVPEINVGTAALAYAAINPAVGLGTFVAQLFLRKPLIAASTREFRVSGTWTDPKVERIERKIGALLHIGPPDAAAPR